MNFSNCIGLWEKILQDVCSWYMDKIEAKQMVSRQNGNKTGWLQKMMDEVKINAEQKDAVGLKDGKRRME